MDRLLKIPSKSIFICQVCHYNAILLCLICIGVKGLCAAGGKVNISFPVSVAVNFKHSDQISSSAYT